MNTPDIDSIKSYYDDRIVDKLRDFTEFKPRIEAAVQTIAAWAPSRPARVLEIGCGIGATTWRMAQAWPDAEVIGADISPRSIEVAKTCFKRSNLSYFQGLIEPGVLTGLFDLIVLMDVYEHIALQDRPILHNTIRDLLSADSRVVVSVPTPTHQRYMRMNHPEAIQPVDENIGPMESEAMATDTQAQLIFYRQVSIWSYGDYAHFVLGRFNAMTRLDERLLNRKRTIRQRLENLFGVGSEPTRNYLGPDFHSDKHSRQLDKLAVPAAKRKKLAASWLSPNPH